MKVMYLLVVPPWMAGQSQLIPDPGLFNTEEEAFLAAEHTPNATVLTVRVGSYDAAALQRVKKKLNRRKSCLVF